MGKLAGEGGGEESPVMPVWIGSVATLVHGAAGFGLRAVGSGILAMFLGPMLWESMGYGGRAAAWPLIFLAIPAFLLGCASLALGIACDLLGGFAFVGQTGAGLRTYWAVTGGSGRNAARLWSPLVGILGLAGTYFILLACAC